MHTIQIIESFGAGTLEVVRALTWHFDRLGWKTTIFHGVRDETPADFKDIFPARTEFVPLVTGRAINPMADMRDVIRIADYARTHDATILHGHSSKGGALARLAAAAIKRPSLYSPHGFSFLSSQGVKKTKLTYWLERVLALLPGRIVCCSKSEMEIARTFTKSVGVIPNFVNIDAMAPASGDAAEPFDVVSVGRISAQKDPSKFLAVARALPNYRFLWLGGPASAIEEDIPENVTITGWMARPLALRKMTQARIFLSTSLYEGMPLSVLEAQALGLAVVSTPALGSRDVVSHEVNGVLAQEAADIATAISDLMKDDERRNHYITAATRRLQAEHDESGLLGEWETLYRRETERSHEDLAKRIPA